MVHFCAVAGMSAVCCAAVSGLRDILLEEKGRRKRARKFGMWLVIGMVRMVRMRKKRLWGESFRLIETWEVGCEGVNEK